MPASKGFKYVYSFKHVTEVLKKAQETGRPEKLSLSYLEGYLAAQECPIFSCNRPP